MWFLYEFVEQWKTHDAMSGPHRKWDFIDFMESEDPKMHNQQSELHA